jgi:putative sigma-54 modulation protein
MRSGREKNGSLDTKWRGYMNIDIKGVHHEVDDETRDYINKKLHRIAYATELIVDLLFTITLEKQRYKLEVTMNFRWGASSHIRVTSFEIFKGVDILFDKLENKIQKEKERIQER